MGGGRSKIVALPLRDSGSGSRSPHIDPAPGAAHGALGCRLESSRITERCDPRIMRFFTAEFSATWAFGRSASTAFTVQTWVSAFAMRIDDMPYAVRVV